MTRSKKRLNRLRSLAHDPTADPNFLAALHGDEDERVRLFVIDNPSTPDYILTLMSFDSSPTIRSAVAVRTRSQDVLKRLSHDDSIYVRFNAIKNSNITEETLLELLDDKELCRKYDITKMIDSTLMRRDIKISANRAGDDNN